MALKPLLSFSSGELDPILHDHVTLEKFRKGLATCRNAMISKTGGILSRFPTAHFKQSKNTAEPIKLFSPPNSNKILEWGYGYVRLYDFDGTLEADVSHTYPNSYLDTVQFVASGKFVYTFVEGDQIRKFLYDDASPAFVAIADIFKVPDAPTGLVITANGSPSGYAVHYLVTKVENGEESLAVQNTSGSYNKPDASGQSNTISVTIDAAFANADKYNEIRVYRRPANGGAYGYLGSSTDFRNASGALAADFEDLGSLADFTNGTQDIVTKLGFDGQNIQDLNPRTGAVYQQRLLISPEDNEEAILASRPGYQNNFYRDFPYDDDSSLLFKSGTTGKAKVLRIVDNDGLIVFTSIGVFVSVGTLSVDNNALEKRGSWVIDENIPPLAVPGGVFFVDKATNSVRQLIFSRDIATYETIDHSIFSDHLFKQKTLTSWAYQQGDVPLIIATFSDGTFATFTYHQEHKMRAWTRHDSAYSIEQVEGTGIADSSFFVVNKGGNRYITVSLPRFIPAATFATNPEADKLNSNAFMDAVKTQSNLLNDSLTGSDVFLLVPVTADTWDGNLTLTCGTSGIFTTGTFGAVGTIMRFFDPTDKTEVDLEVISRTSDNEVVVRPSSEFPSANASGFRLYETFTTVTGLDHLEGENVGILLDGYVSNSPNNDVERYTAVTVSSGSITIPNGERGAIIVVGRPIVADIKTLNISTVEQAPTLIESVTVDKIYIRFFETRGLYISNNFPEENSGGIDGSSVQGMEDLDVFDVPSGTDIIGNRYKRPASKRVEQTLPGTWESNGQIAIRQVDPVHFEILSIIPDVEVLRRSNR